VVGHVLDSLSGAPLATTALTLLDSTGASLGYAESDSTGLFVLKARRPGRYQLYVDRLAYRAFVSDTLTLEKDGKVQVLFRLVPTPVELDPMAISVKGRDAKLDKVGFYRRKSAVGYLIGPEEVRDRRPFITSDLLRQVPGVRLGFVHANGYVPVSGRQDIQMLNPDTALAEIRACLMKVIVDGSKVPTDAGLSLNDLVPAQEVLAVEVYPARSGVGAPVQYRGTDAYCGVVLIWTK